MKDKESREVYLPIYAGDGLVCCGDIVGDSCFKILDGGDRGFGTGRGHVW